MLQLVQAPHPRRFATRWLLAGPFVVVATLMAFCGAGCASNPVDPVRRSVDLGAGREAPPPWDTGRAEVLEWEAVDPAFAQDHALEASGLAATADGLWLPSEKYGRLLWIDPANGRRAEVVRLAVPTHAELEGITVVGQDFLLCDEAHAAIYEVAMPVMPLGDRDQPRPLAIRELSLHGVDAVGGKIGFEGIAGAPDGGFWLLLERAGDELSGCVSRIWRLRRDGPTDASVVGEPIDIQLEDCAWRLTALELWRGHLLGLKTQFPGERYEVLEIDPAEGGTRVVLDLTDLLRSVRADSWGNNVEGLAISDDGSMWMVGDNRVSGVVDDEQPPSWPDEKALLLRLPPTSQPTSHSGQSAVSCPPGR